MFEDNVGSRLTFVRLYAQTVSPFGLAVFFPNGYVKSVFIVHVGGTRYVTSSTDNIMKIHSRITLKVEFIRGYIFICLFYVCIQGRV